MLRTQPTRTQPQQQIVDQLVERFGVDGRKVIFFPEDPTYPWMPGKQLAKVARLSGEFSLIRVDHEKTMEVGRDTQIHSQAIVADLEGHTYSLPGVATIGEKIPETEDVANPWELADARALRSTLDVAGFNPADPHSIVAANGNGNDSRRDPAVAEVETRRADIARIHIIAREKGLIVGKDHSLYRKRIAKFLNKLYDGKETVAGFDALQRKSFIEFLLQSPADDVPPEFAELEEGAAVQ